MKTLETERILLRALTKDDIEDFYEYTKNSNVGFNAGWRPHENKEESAKILRSIILQNEDWAIVWKQNNKVIGTIGLHHDYRRLGVKEGKMLGYALSEKYWDRGIMTEVGEKILEHAFKDLTLEIVSVYHYAKNIRSKRVIEKLKFKYEGLMRCSSKTYDKRVEDEYFYSILKKEYLNIE